MKREDTFEPYRGGYAEHRLATILKQEATDERNGGTVQHTSGGKVKKTPTPPERVAREKRSSHRKDESARGQYVVRQREKNFPGEQPNQMQETVNKKQEGNGDAIANQ